jgi:hypothetical protein
MSEYLTTAELGELVRTPVETLATGATKVKAPTGRGLVGASCIGASTSTPGSPATARRAR